MLATDGYEVSNVGRVHKAGIGSPYNMQYSDVTVNLQDFLAYKIGLAEPRKVATERSVGVKCVDVVSQKRQRSWKRLPEASYTQACEKQVDGL